jgi:hypothetical protein
VRPLIPALLATTVAVAQQGPWPAAVSNAGIVWDSAAGQVLLYGGMRDRGLHSDSALWAWNGTRWTPLGDGAPGARSGTILMWDGKGKRVLLYGGQNRTAQFDDTWEWKDAHWNRVSVRGPGARHMTAAVFDPVRNQAVLFGGYSVERQTMLGDTWVWDGSAWKPVPGEGPPARAGHALGFDPTRGQIVLMGGMDAGGGQFGDTWGWDGIRWSRLGEGPAITPNSPMAGLPNGGLGAFGGWDGSKPSGVLFQWSGTAWRNELDQSGPSPRMETALAFDRTRGRTVLFGGSDANGVKLNDLWEYDGTAWKAVNPNH